MGQTPENKEAIEKLKKIAEDVHICMLADTENESHGWPMWTVKVEDDGTLWFFTKDKKALTDRMKNDYEIALQYSDAAKNSYLTVQGIATFVEDKKEMEALYIPALKAWFPHGIEEPGIVLLKVMPEQAHYWDADSATTVTLFSTVKEV